MGQIEIMTSHEVNPTEAACTASQLFETMRNQTKSLIMCHPEKSLDSRGHNDEKKVSMSQQG